MGRNTYDAFMLADPTTLSWGFPRSVPIFVLTNRNLLLPGPGRPLAAPGNSVAGAVEKISSLIEEDLKLYVAGGGKIIGSFVEEGLLDGITITTVSDDDDFVDEENVSDDSQLFTLSQWARLKEEFIPVRTPAGDKESKSVVVEYVKPPKSDKKGSEELERPLNAYSGVELGSAEVSITNHLWSLCKPPKKPALGVLGRNDDANEFEQGIENPLEIVYAPSAIISSEPIPSSSSSSSSSSTTSSSSSSSGGGMEVFTSAIDVDPTAWIRAVGCQPPPQSRFLLLTYPTLSRKQAGLPPSLRRCGYMIPWEDRIDIEQERLENLARMKQSANAGFGVFGSLFGGGGAGAGAGRDGGRPNCPLPTLQERKEYLVRGVLRKSLESLAKLHSFDIAHRSLGSDSILMTPRRRPGAKSFSEDLNRFGYEVGSLYAKDVDRLGIIFTDLGFAGRISMSHLDAEFMSRARGFGINKGATR